METAAASGKKKNRITIATIYRPLKLQAPDDTFLYEEIKSNMQNEQAIVIGDFDCLNIDWIARNGNHEGDRLIEMVENSFLKYCYSADRRE